MRPGFSLLFVWTLLLSACSPVLAATVAPPVFPTPPATAQPLPTHPAALTLWAEASVPAELRAQAQAGGLAPAQSSAAADVRLGVALPDAPGPRAGWVYVLVAAFPTVAEAVSFSAIKAAWFGNDQALLMTESTAGAMKTLFGGDPGPGVKMIPAPALTEALWQDKTAWALVPFDELNPKLKVLAVDGLSPIQKSFDPAHYPLKVAFGFSCSGSCAGLPALTANRDPARLVTVVMTGVTALVRATALKMEQNGLDYPAREIGGWLREADIAHISDEVAFAPGCPFPDANQTSLMFCSAPRYFELLKDVGADVVELTGNHLDDWGKQATLHTLEMYRQAGLPYFGGGVNLADAQKPALLERGGVKFAFVGCNPAGPEFAWARENWPGPAPCGPEWPGAGPKENGYGWIVDEIKALKAQGYVVIATLQYYEYYSPDPRPWQVNDFHLLAEAGAEVVSGSQGHFAQAMEFDNGAFIHYGLGNLFFDQMGYTNPSSGKRTTDTRREFLDRYVFYAGRLVSIELLTAHLEDYAKPRPMTAEERAAFLSEYFQASGWGPESLP